MKLILKIIITAVIMMQSSVVLRAQNCMVYDEPRNSVSIGYNGNNNYTLGTFSYTMGWDIQRSNNESVIIGSGADASNPLSNTYGGIAFGMGSTVPTMRITSALNSHRTGSVVIGDIVAPQAKLHIHSDSSLDAAIMLTTTTGSNKTIIKFRTDANYISVGQDNVMRFYAGGLDFETQQAMGFSASSYTFSGGKVGIGCVNNIDGYLLAVKGGMISSKISVMDIGVWPDFVFGNDYNLMNLYELEKYIGENRHLPGVPSAGVVADEGIDLGEMNSILLQKIEELTLHIIELQKQIDELKAR